jgi:hypothetical protein
VNGDGFSDLIVRVNIDELQLNFTDTKAALAGRTFEGQLISGVDSIKIVH